MTISHTLYEWTPSDPIELTVLQRDAIAQLAKGMSISPVQGTRSCFRLTPDSNVGAIVVGDLSIAILPKPKVTLEHVLFMLSYSVRLPPWDGARFAFAEDSLVEAVVPAFVGEVSAQSEEDSFKATKSRKTRFLPFAAGSASMTRSATASAASRRPKCGSTSSPKTSTPTGSSRRRRPCSFVCGFEPGSRVARCAASTR